MFRLLLAVSLVAGAWGDITDINLAVDQLLDSIKQSLQVEGKNKIPLPNLDKAFDQKILGDAVIHGEFHADGGSFSDLSSIKRTGDATLETNGNKITLSASLGLDMLAVDYINYNFQLLAIHSEGSIHASSTRNSIKAVISIVHAKKECNVELGSAQVLDIGDFDVKMSGPGALNKVGTVVLPWILNQFDVLVKNQINLHLEQALRDALKNVNLCNKIPI